MKKNILFRTLESDIIVPALIIIAEHKKITTSGLADKLERLYCPTGEDAVAPKNRNDMKIRQIIRNLVSHRTLDKSGVAIYENGYLRITDKGRDTVALILKTLWGVAV